MREDQDVFILGEDIAEMGGSMGVTQGMLEEFGPERVRNTPISEMAIVGAAIGAAMQGMRPVVEIMYEDFLTLAMEQIVNQAAKHRSMSGGQLKVPLTVRTQGGAGWSPGAQHAQQVEAWFVHVPGLKVVFAVDAGGRARAALVVDLRRQPGRLLRAPDAVRDQGRGARGARADSAREGARPPRGNGRDRGRNGPARARVAEGGGGGRVEGISVEVVDPRTLLPLDEEAIVRRWRRRLAASWRTRRSRAWGSAPRLRRSSSTGFDYLDAPIERVGAKFAPIPFAPVMENYVVPHAADVLEAIQRTVAADDG